MMATTVMTGSFAVALTVLAVHSEKARQRGNLQPCLVYFFVLAAAFAWLLFFAAVIEVFQ